MTSRRLVIQWLSPVPCRRFLRRLNDLVEVFGIQGDGVIQPRQIDGYAAVRPDTGDLPLDLHRVSFFNLISHNEYLARAAREARV